MSGESAQTDEAFAARAKLLVGVACAALFSYFVYNAWVCDDAYITFRTVDNAVSGHGLRWNTHERVQTYTHPLWMFIHLPLYALTRDAFLTTILISLACSIAAVLLVLRQSTSRPWLTIGVLLVPMGLATAFIEYTTSGLENPMTFLLLALFIRELEREEEVGGIRPAWLGLFAALGVLNRLDSALLFLPGMVWYFGKNPTRKTIAAWVPGGLLMLAWEVFSVLYYGFPFPNTSYAKLGTGIEKAAQIEKGLAYARDLYWHHPTSALLLFAGLVLGAWQLSKPLRRDKHEIVPPVLALGAAAYCAYTIWVGGDFMSGRFWAAPVFLAVVILHRVALHQWPASRDRFTGMAVVLLLVVSFGLGRAIPRKVVSGIGSERDYYGETNLLRNYLRGHGPDEWRLSKLAVKDRQYAQGLRTSGASERHVIRTGSVGMPGFYAGPDVIVLDPLALGDALLARLPVQDPYNWRPGHFVREIPRGYEEVLRTSTTAYLHPSLRDYFQKLQTVISGPIWSRERLGAIVAFNLGYYDDLRDVYLGPVPFGRVALEELQTEPAAGTPWDAAGLIQLPQRAQLTVTVSPARSATQLDISTDTQGIYRVGFLEAGAEVGVVMAQAPFDSPAGTMLTQLIPLPESALDRAIDGLTIEPRGGHRPWGGAERHSIGYVNLR